MASAFKAIGKFMFGSGGNQQPAAPPAQPAPAQNPTGTPNTSLLYTSGLAPKQGLAASRCASRRCSRGR